MKLIRAFLFILLVSLMPKGAWASCASSMNYVFTNGVSALDANATNSNNNQLLSCAKGVDNSQIGSAGIYANQIIPTNTTQATFGGTQAYTFPAGVSATSVTSHGPLTATTVTASSSIQGSYINSAYNGSTNQGIFYAGGGNVGSLDYNVTNANFWTFSAPLVVAGNVESTAALSGMSSNVSGSSQASYFNSAYNGSTTQGIYYAGGSNAASLDYSLANSNAWTLSAPLFVVGAVNGTSFNSGGTGTFGALISPSLSSSGGSTLINNSATVNGALTVNSTLNANATNVTSLVASGQAKSVSAGGASGYNGPIVFSNGTTSSNFHGVLLTGTAGASTSACASTGSAYCLHLTLSGGAAFSSATTYSCTLTDEKDSSGAYTYKVTSSNFPQSPDGTSFYLVANNGSGVLSSMCWGY